MGLAQRVLIGVRLWLIRRGVAQSGSASALGAEGREFESLHPDHPPSLKLRRDSLNQAEDLEKRMSRRNEVKTDLTLKYVYIIQSVTQPERYYTGCTIDLKRRISEHNTGQSPHTRKFMPWKLINYIAFSDHEKADKFEIYLKTASGRAFAKKHF